MATPPRSRRPSPRTSPDPGGISLDQAIKDLLSRYPVDAWRFLLPELARRLGDPVSWEFLRPEARKHDLHRKGYVMDLPIRYRFGSGEEVVVVVLIEHWATARSVNLHRTAHYVLDLMEREPGRPVVPVALLTEQDPGTVSEEIEMDSLLDRRPVLYFRHHVRAVGYEDLAHWRRRSNVVAAVLTGGMKGRLSLADKARLAFLELERLVDAEEVGRLSPLVFAVGKLDREAQERIMAAKSKLPEPHLFKLLKAQGKAEGIAEGAAKGEVAGKLEAARRLVGHGVDWKIITDVTGVRPADLGLTSASKPSTKAKTDRKSARK